MSSIDISEVLQYWPQPRQQKFHDSDATQILFGGAVGGGKSCALRAASIYDCLMNPGCQAYIFRRTYRELEDNHIRYIRSLPRELGAWVESRKKFEFVNGSALVCGFAETEGEVNKYQGAEIHKLAIDEAGNFTPFQLAFLLGRNRTGGWTPKQKGRFPRAELTANPGGTSHNFLKGKFIDPAPPETEFYDASTIDPKTQGHKGRLTVYIPSKMDDNKYLDAGYGGQLNDLPPELAKALRDGDWDVVVGSFFGSLWSRERHVIPPFQPPEHWLRWGGYDHGSASPFAMLWLTMASEDYVTDEDRLIPKGAAVVYREWYGATSAHRGLKMIAEEIADGIRAREDEEENVAFRVMDPSAFKIDSGPSIAERFLRRGVAFRRADNVRIAGWQEIMSRLRGDDGLPMLYVFDTCTNLIRTLPVLTHDSVRLEDINTREEDHAADALRYALMARPYRKNKPKHAEDPWRPQTINEMLDAEEHGSKRRERI